MAFHLRGTPAKQWGSHSSIHSPSWSWDHNSPHTGPGARIPPAGKPRPEQVGGSVVPQLAAEKGGLGTRAHCRPVHAGTPGTVGSLHVTEHTGDLAGPPGRPPP